MGSLLGEIEGSSSGPQQTIGHAYVIMSANPVKLTQGARKPKRVRVKRACVAYVLLDDCHGWL